MSVELLDEIEQKLLEPAEDYAKLVSRMATNAKVDAVAAAATMRALGKSRKDLDDDVKSYRERIKLADIIKLGEDKPKRRDEIDRAVRAASDKCQAAKQKAVDELHATCAPLQAEVDEILAQGVRYRDAVNRLRETASPKLKAEAREIQKEMEPLGQRIADISSKVRDCEDRAVEYANRYRNSGESDGARSVSNKKDSETMRAEAERLRSQIAPLQAEYDELSRRWQKIQDAMLRP